MRLGAHVSTQGGLDNAIDRAQAMGAETIQIFGAAPQTWRRRAISDEEAAAFREKAAAADVAPVFLHAIYLISLVSDDPAAIEKQRRLAGRRPRALRAHRRQGQHRPRRQPQGRSASMPYCRASPPPFAHPRRDAARIVAHPREQRRHGRQRRRPLRRAGRDHPRSRRPARQSLPRHPARLRHGLRPDRRKGPGRRRSTSSSARSASTGSSPATPTTPRSPLGGVRDRHENIGEGHIGRDGFRRIFAHPAFAEIPFILEVPGFGNLGPDKENLDILKEIRREAGAAP